VALPGSPRQTSTVPLESALHHAGTQAQTISPSVPPACIDLKALEGMDPKIMEVLQAQGSGKDMRAAALQIAEMLLASMKAEPIEHPLHLSPLPVAKNLDSDGRGGLPSSPISESHSHDSDQSYSQPPPHGRHSHSQRILSESEDEAEGETQALHLSDAEFDQSLLLPPTQLVGATWDDFTSEGSLDLNFHEGSAVTARKDKCE
jgi:hypothetical protein